MTPNCERRATSTVSPQALFMMNSAFVGDQAEAMAGRIEREAAADANSRFCAAWQLVFGVRPTERETREGLAFLAGQAQMVDPERSLKKTAADERRRQQLPLAHLCKALLVSNGLLYVD
jgi:hypothetical protein